MENVESPIKITSLGELREDNRVILERFLPDRLRGRSGVRVLSVGCGFAPEAIPIMDILTDAQFLGADINKNLIAGARAFNSKLPPQSFQRLDLRESESFGEIPWDLIILRNPQIRGEAHSGFVAHITVDWERILLNCANRLNENGYVYIACQDRNEISDVVDFFRDECGFEVVLPVTSLARLYLRSNFPNLEEYVALLNKPPLPVKR